MVSIGMSRMLLINVRNDRRMFVNPVCYRRGLCRNSNLVRIRMLI